MRHFATIALVLPCLTVIALIARAEVKLRSGAEWTVPILGYDPRDLLQGHYLNYTVDWDAGERVADADCLCLLGQPGTRPTVRWTACDASESDCRSVVSERGQASLRRYYVSESASADVSDRVRAGASSLRIVVSPTGDVQVKTLLIDGQPWP